MSLIRLALLLLFLGGVTLFALQNWSPVLPLVILGTQTLALPLAAWMVGAIVVGGATTLVLAGLFQVSNAFAVRSRRSSKRAATRFDDSPKPPWNPAWDQPQTAEPMDVPFTVTNPGYGHRADQGFDDAYSAPAANSEDDWESNRRSEEWEDWQDDRQPDPPPVTVYQPQAHQPQARQPQTYSNTVLQDNFEPEDFRQEDFRPSESERFDVEDRETNLNAPEREEWEDWEDYEELDEADQDDRSPDASEPARPIYEIQQEPKTRYQSGSVYSYSYRDAERAEREIEDHETGSSKDAADFRVLIPPYQPEVTPVAEDTEAVPASDLDEDWGFEDDDDFEPDDRHPRRSKD